MNAEPNLQTQISTTRRSVIKFLVAFCVLVLGALGSAYWYFIRCDGRWHGVPFELRGTADLQALEVRLRTDIAFLQSLGPRHIANEIAYLQLMRCADWIEQEWQTQGYRVQRHEFTVNEKTCANLEIEIPGTSAGSEIVVISAQYDTLPDSPGANNNGSGVAVLLRLSELLKHQRPDRTVRLVQFVNEEDPFFGTDQMGSYVYAKACHGRGDNICAMLSLDSIGIYKHTPGSQRLPWPFSLFYPDRGDFLAFIGNLSSRQCVKVATRGFRKGSSFPIAAGLAPEWVKGVTWSDHASFWKFGYPGVQVTDTGAFRSASHTTREDTMDKIDFGSLARITHGLYGAIMELSSKRNDLSFQNQPSHWLLFNGAVVLLAGILVGFPLWRVIEQDGAGSTYHAWRVAHATLIAQGLWMLAIAVGLCRLALSNSAIWIVVWSMVAAGYGFVFAMTLGAWTRRRGLSPKPWGINTLLFAGHAVGVVGSLVAAVLILYGALHAI